MPQNPRENIGWPGSAERINRARVEEVLCQSEVSGSVLVSYSVPERNNTSSMQRIWLEVGRNTQIRNLAGQNVCLCCLTPGSLINAVVSSRMTRSIPPRASAFLIIVTRAAQPPARPPVRPPVQPPIQPPVQPPIRPSDVTTGRIVLIDFDNRFLITEDPADPNNQIRFNLTDETVFVNRFGRPVSINALWPGEMVRVTHANFMTASIPPQTTAFRVQIF